MTKKKTSKTNGKGNGAAKGKAPEAKASKAKEPKPPKPVEPEKPEGILLEKSKVFELEEPMSEEEARNARHNAREAKAQLDWAVDVVEKAKATLKAAKEEEEDRRAIWDERAMLLARGQKKVKVPCRVVLEEDDHARAYRLDNGLLVDERAATSDEIRKAKQPSLFAVDGGPLAGADAATPPAEPAPVVALAETKAKKGKGPAKLDAPTEADWLAEEPAKAPEGEAPAPLREVEYDAPGPDAGPETEPYHRRFGDDGSDQAPVYP